MTGPDGGEGRVESPAPEAAAAPAARANGAGADDILRMEGVTKSFGAIVVLRGVDLHLKRGEVLGLIGDNGAGKSTLVKIISGYHQPDGGTMWVDGEEVSFHSVDDARARGVDTVYQDLALVDGLSVYHNMFLKRELIKKPLPFLSNREMKRRSREALDAIGIQTIRSVDQEVARLSGGQRQAIAVARSVFSSNPKILLLDEPLAAMGVKEGAMILDLVRRLKAEGKVSIIMIAHNYLHVLETCDRVNMIRDGRVFLDKRTGDTSVEELTEVAVQGYREAQQGS
jgi:ABC-type sugar transport system ATPase subunit